MNPRLSRPALMILLALAPCLQAMPPAPGQARLGKAAPKPKPVDINGASKAELMKLPGITEAYADKIIAGRPYLTKAHLVTHGILPSGVYEPIKHKIYASQKTAKP